MIVKTEPRHHGFVPSRNPKYCERCGASTREGKPYCPEHVEEHPYVQGVLDALAEQEAEQQRAVSKGIHHISDSSITAQEIHQYLCQHGARTFRRIAKDLGLDGEVVKVYARYLVVHGKATNGMTRRHDMTLQATA